MSSDAAVGNALQNHPGLFSAPRFSASAKRQKQIHTLSLARTQQRAAAAKAALARRQQVRRLAAYQAATPASVICRIFGDHSSSMALDA